MLAKNFKIVDSIGIEFNERFLDLHSNYDFKSLSYDIQNKTIELGWTKCAGDWAKDEIYQGLKLVFSCVYVFSVRPRDNDKSFSEDDCLSFLGYLHPDDLELMDGFLPLEKAGKNYDLFLGFESGLAIKLYAEAVELQVFE